MRFFKKEDYEPYMCADMIELIKRIRNRCDFLLLCSGFDDLDHAIPTLIEDVFEDAQDLVEYCEDED